MERKSIYIYSLVLSALLMLTACSTDSIETPSIDNGGGNETETAVNAAGYFKSVQTVVPVATDVIYVEYTDATGKKDTKTVDVSNGTSSSTRKLLKAAGENNGGTTEKGASAFKTVSILLQSKETTTVNVYYTNNQKNLKIVALENVDISEVPLSGSANDGVFGETRFVKVSKYSFLYTTVNKKTVPTNPGDVVVLNKAHNHICHYRFAYKDMNYFGTGYYLLDAYDVTYDDAKGFNVAKDRAGYDYHQNKPKNGALAGQTTTQCVKNIHTMPWGCDCTDPETAQKTVNPNFKSNNGVDPWVEATPDPSAPVKIVDLEGNVTPTTTADGNQMFYHSKGVVMFDESWPTVPAATKAVDYNDVVIDYDLEAKTADVTTEPKLGGREQLKVVMHLRTLGGETPQGVGLVIDGLKNSNVESVEKHITLDSWQNPRGTLPDVVTNNITADVDMTQDNPLMTFTGIQWLKSAEAAATHYTKTDNNGGSRDVVVNRMTGYSTPDATQYISTITNKAPDKTYYNTIPGYVNVDAGLITFTYIFHFKDRSKMTAEESAAQIQNLIDAVNNTDQQNFFITVSNGAEIHLRGYKPTYKYTEGYATAVAANSDLDQSNGYMGTSGKIWGVKCPVLTRHAWEGYDFNTAYPDFAAWLSSNGSEKQDWYLQPAGDYVSCWW